MSVEIEATSTFFDRIDGWYGRRRVLPMGIETALKDLPPAENWVGGGQELRSGRRLVWRSRAGNLEVAEIWTHPDRLGSRNGIELPFSVLSRDAVFFEEAPDSRDESLVVWALTRDLVLHAVPFKATSGQDGRGYPDESSQDASLLALLPRREACDGVGLSPPSGSEYPTCCTFVNRRNLIIGYETGRLQIVRVTRERSVADAAGGEAPCILQVQVVRELPAAGYLSYLNPLAYRQSNTSPPSPIIALGGCAADGDDLLVFSLHADRKLRAWSSRSKGMLNEISLPEAVDRGLLYSSCSKIVVYNRSGRVGAKNSYHLAVSLAEPSHSRLWVSKPFFTTADVEGWRDAHLAAFSFEEDQLIADICLSETVEGDGRMGEPRSRLKLWAVLAKDGLVYASLDNKEVGVVGGRESSRHKRAPSLVRLWRASFSGLENVDVLLRSVGSGGRESGDPVEGSRNKSFSHALLILHKFFGAEWKATARYIETSFLRALSVPDSGFSCMALMNAIRRIKPAPPPGRDAGEGATFQDREAPPPQERLWELVADTVRVEADRALAEALRRRACHLSTGDEVAEVKGGHKEVLALLSAWTRFLNTAAECRDVLSQPLGFLANADDGGSARESARTISIVRVDRCSAVVPVRLPLGPKSHFLDMFDAWVREYAPDAAMEINGYLWKTLVSTGQLPDPSLLKARAVHALEHRAGAGEDAGMILKSREENHRLHVKLSTEGVQAIREVEGVLTAVGHLLQDLGDSMEATSQYRAGTVRAQSCEPPSANTEDAGVYRDKEQSGGGESLSVETAGLAASAVREILRHSLARLVTSYLLVLHLETLGMHHLFPQDDEGLSLSFRLVIAINSAWLVYFSSSLPLQAPTPIRPSSAITIPTAPSLGLRPAYVLESMAMSLGLPGASLSTLEAAIHALCQRLPAKLMTHLLRTQQFRYLLPWGSSFLDGALLPSFSSSPPLLSDGRMEEEETPSALTRHWQRLVAYAYLSEARLLSREPGQAQAAEILFQRTVSCFKEWDTCMTPPFADFDEEVTDDKRMLDQEKMHESRIPGLARLAHYAQAMALLEQSVGMPGCSPILLVDLAYAGLRCVPLLPGALCTGAEKGDQAEFEQIRWCLEQAAALWATIFRACTDHLGLDVGRFVKEGSGSVRNASSVYTGSLEEAFLAMRAELFVAQDLQELIEQDMFEAAEVSSAATMGQKGRHGKLSYLVVEICEQGRIDLICSLPWAQNDAVDEVVEVENVLRSSARFSTIEEHEDIDPMNVAGKSPMGGNVDYYKAAFAFLVSQNNFRQAALEMYRLAKRLDYATVYEDNLVRLDQKIEALSAVHDCICLVENSGEYPFLLWTYEEKSLHSPASISHATHTDSKRTCVVTRKRVEQELSYAFTARQYLLVAGPNASPLRPLNMSFVHPQGGSNGGESNGRLTKTTLHQVKTAAVLLCNWGLYESAVSLFKIFGIPMQMIIAALAKTFAFLRKGRADVHMVLEDGPGWLVGEDAGIEEVRSVVAAESKIFNRESKTEDVETRRQVYIRLAMTLASEGCEAKVIAEHAGAAEWLLKDLVQRYDWAHSCELHTEAVRFILACDSFRKPPRWLSSAFTRGLDARGITRYGGWGKSTTDDGNGESGTHLDKEFTSEGLRIPRANTGAFLQMHVDKAIFVVNSSYASEKKISYTTDVCGPSRYAASSISMIHESLHLLAQALIYAEEIVERATEQLFSDAVLEVWLPRRSLTALLQRTQEILEMSAELEVPDRDENARKIHDLRVQAEERLLDLKDKKLLAFDMHLEDKERILGVKLNVMKA